MPIPHRSPLFILFLGALSALPPLSIDMGLPALHAIGEELGATPAEAGMTLSLFLLGFSLAPVLLGPLSDRFGRRPVLLAGLIVFAAAGVACTLSGSIGTLLFCRLVQGAGAGAGAALPIAIVRDLFEGAEGRARLSYVTLVLGVAPAIAPTLGAAVLGVGGWRGIYGLLGMGGVLLLLVSSVGFAESRRPGQRHSLHPLELLLNYGRLLRHRVFIGSALVNALAFGCMFSYVSGAPLVLMGNLGVTSGVFGALFACTALGIILGSTLAGRLAGRVPPALLLRIALLVAVAVTLVALGVSLFGPVTLLTLMPPLVLACFCYGVIGPNATHEAMQPMGARAGTASALLRSLQMLSGAVASGLVALLYDGRSALSMTGVMTCCAVLALLCHAVVLRGGRAAA